MTEILGQSAGVTVRLAAEGDLEGIMTIERTVFAHEAWPDEAMRRDIVSPNCFYVVGELAATGQIVGYAGLQCPPGAGDGDIQTIATHPTVRSRGLGRVMMGELIEEAAKRGAHRLFLEVRSDNPIAIGLYRALGFHEIGSRPGYYQPDNVDAVIMRLDPVPGGPGERSVGPVGSEAITWEDKRKSEGAC